MKLFQSERWLVVLLIFPRQVDTVTIKEKLGGSVFARGPVASLTSTELSNLLRDDRSPSVAASTSRLINTITKKQFGATGQETWTLEKTVTDDSNNKHLRFYQTYEGLPVVDAAMMMHVNDQGVVYAVNGELVVKGVVDMNQQISCRKAFQDVPSEAKYNGNAVWLTGTPCPVKIVIDEFGVAHKAWERMIGYQPVAGPYQKDMLYASVVTGDIVAIRPKVYSAMALDTRNCYNMEYNCPTVTTNNSVIDTDDQAIDDAHNFAIATYKYFFNNFGRDSLNGHGMTMISNVHVGQQYSNAFWDGSSVNYGDGDGKWGCRSE